MAKLWVCLGLMWAQPLLPLSRLVYYSTGKVYWVREAVVPMLRSQVSVRIIGRSQPLFILPQPEYRLKRWFFSPDTFLIDVPQSSETMKEFLRTHIGSGVWISYAVGNEWEEVQGVIERISEKGDVLLRRPTQELLWLPAKVIRAIRTEANVRSRTFMPGWRITLEADTPLPAARIAVAGWDSMSPWRASHILQLVSPTRASLTTQIHLPRLLEDVPQLEVFLLQSGADSTRTYTWHLPMQKVLAHHQNHLFLLKAELPYTDLYRASLPDLVESLDPFALSSWRGFAERSLQLLNVGQIAIPAGSVHILDEQGLPIAQSQLSVTPPAGTGYIPLSDMAGIELRLQEQESRRERSRDPALGPKVNIVGSLRIQNSTSRDARLVIQKPITGQPVLERLGFARATPLPERRGPNPRFLLQWELLLRPGAIETLDYSYDLLLPAASK
ncbi:MAG: hypothetical protein N2200_08135 [Bacteroidia bacterium]|nr:hypothetical protein [Bacteroidia bacterium]